jgi:hypothetical protein
MTFKSPHKEYVLVLQVRGETRLVHFREHLYTATDAHEAQAIRELIEFKQGGLVEVK